MQQDCFKVPVMWVKTCLLEQIISEQCSKLSQVQYVLFSFLHTFELPYYSLEGFLYWERLPLNKKSQCHCSMIEPGFEAVFSLTEVCLKQVCFFLRFYPLPMLFVISVRKNTCDCTWKGKKKPFSTLEAVYGCFFWLWAKKERDLPEYFYVMIIIIPIFQEWIMCAAV